VKHVTSELKFYGVLSKVMDDKQAGKTKSKEEQDEIKVFVID